MNHASAITATGKYEPVSQSEMKHNVRDTVVPVGHNASPSRPTTRTTGSIQFLCAATLTCLTPLVAIAVWGGLNSHQMQSQTALSGAPIGGRLTQPQAKAVDLLASALLAPLLMAILNYVWFTCARTAAVTELNARPISLRTLSVASSSATGSYNLFGLWELVVKSKAPRLILLGCLVLTAAVTNTALTNIIAYEAYMVEGATSSVNLQYLRDDLADQASTAGSGVSVSTLYSYNNEQTSSFSKEFTGMLTGLSMADARPMLNDSEYYMINATSASLNALQANIIDLPNVPAAKYEIQCRAAQPINPGPIQQGEKQVIISFTLNETNSLNGTLFSALYPGKITTLQDAYNEYYSFIGFPPGWNNYSYMLFTTSFDESNYTVATPYGTIKPVAQNMTLLGFTGTKSIMSWWGMYCWLVTTPGTVDMRRGSDSSWTARSYTWQNDKAANVTKWSMQSLQLALDYSAPGSTVPGIGPALAMGTDNTSAAFGPEQFDYPTTALNMLYAECETKRMIYEIAATNQSRAKADYFYQAAATGQAEFYRITYVPLILFVAIGTMVLGAIISLGLMISAWRSESARKLRTVDVLRLVVDSAAGLNDEDTFAKMSRASNAQIENWAGDYAVRYRVRQVDSYHEPQVVLTKASKDLGT